MLQSILEKQNIYTMYIRHSSHIKMTKYYFDLEDMKNTFDSFKDKLGAITILKENDKVSFDIDNKTYIDQGHMLQSFKRWYYGESRDITRDRLSAIFEDYNKYLMMVLRSLYNQSNYTFYDLADTVSIFNKQLITGLQNLHKTYTNGKDYNGKLSDLINIIIEYLRQFEQQYNAHSNRVRR
jgi:hypothetical protein